MQAGAVLRITIIFLTLISKGYASPLSLKSGDVFIIPHHFEVFDTYILAQEEGGNLIQKGFVETRDLRMITVEKLERGLKLFITDEQRQVLQNSMDLFAKRADTKQFKLNALQYEVNKAGTEAHETMWKIEKLYRKSMKVIGKLGTIASLNMVSFAISGYLFLPSQLDPVDQLLPEHIEFRDGVYVLKVEIPDEIQDFVDTFALEDTNRARMLAKQFVLNHRRKAAFFGVPGVVGGIFLQYLSPIFGIVAGRLPVSIFRIIYGTYFFKKKKDRISLDKD